MAAMEPTRSMVQYGRYPGSREVMSVRLRRVQGIRCLSAIAERQRFRTKAPGGEGGYEMEKTAGTGTGGGQALDKVLPLGVHTANSSASIRTKKGDPSPARHPRGGEGYSTGTTGEIPDRGERGGGAQLGTRCPPTKPNT